MRAYRGDFIRADGERRDRAPEWRCLSGVYLQERAGSMGLGSGGARSSVGEAEWEKVHAKSKLGEGAQDTEHGRRGAREGE